MDLGILILRVIVGLALAAHGSQKLFGWFGGGGLQGTTGFIKMLGFRPAGLWAALAGLGEFGGGLLLAAGLFNPLGPLGVIAAMATASVAAHLPKGFWNSKGGYELPLTNIAAAVAVAMMGPGRYSLDSALGIAIPQAVAALLVIVVVVGTGLGLLSRRVSQPDLQTAS
jgi:putative oxidoreductase